MYKEIAPSVGMNHLIDSFWTFSNNKTSERFKILPDTYIDLIFDLKHDRAFLSGVMSKYHLREMEADSELIGIRLESEKMGKISEIPNIETQNLRVDLSELFPYYDSILPKKLSHSKIMGERIHLLERFLLRWQALNLGQRDHLILSIAQDIRNLKGVVSIRDLSISHHISVRQMERRFKNHIGLTVKEFSRIVRFNNAKENIKDLIDKSLTEIAFDVGFFDHSHMNYEFNRISGENPSSFR